MTFKLQIPGFPLRREHAKGNCNPLTQREHRRPAPRKESAFTRGVFWNYDRVKR